MIIFSKPNEFEHEVVIEAAATTTSTQTSVVTEQVTEIVTEIIEPTTEIVMVTKIEEIPATSTTEETLMPGTVLEGETNESETETEDEVSSEEECETATLLGLECDAEKNVESQPKKAERLDDPIIDIEQAYVLISSSQNLNSDISSKEDFLVPQFELEELTSTPKIEKMDTISATEDEEKVEEFLEEVEEFLEEDFSQHDGLIQTSPSNLKPDRDDTFESILGHSTGVAQQLIVPASSTNKLAVGTATVDLAESRTDYPQCGKLGGAAVLQAFGRAAHNLLPDLVFSWVTGGQVSFKKKALNSISMRMHTVDFFHNFCFASKHQTFISRVAKMIFRRGQLMIWHQK